VRPLTQSKENNLMVAPARPLFPLGRVVATPGALGTLEAADESPADLLNRHVRGDWGDLDDEDKAANEAALRDGSRIFSAYVLSSGEKIWVISEADRSSTCLLRPDEY